MIKTNIKNEILNYANLTSDIESFKQMLRDVKDAKPIILLNKSMKFNNKDFTISWNKPIQNDTLRILGNAIRKENKTGDMLDGVNNDDYKNTMSMMKALKPIVITVLHKKSKKEYVFNILDTTEDKKTKITLIYKILFFYSYSYLNKVLKQDD